MRALLLTLLLGCAGTQKAGIQAPSATRTALAATLTHVEGGEIVSLPEPVALRLAEAMEARNLVPSTLDAAGTFAKTRTTPQRLAWVAEQGGGAELLVLVEAEAEFYSQLNGRYRWTVSVTATVAPAGDPGQAVTSVFTVPVFLQFHREREPEALAEAGPVIERQVGHLLDEYLSGL